MPILEIQDRLDLTRPALVLAISGWVDGGMVATKVGEHLASHGNRVAEFRPDDIYDYRTARPTLEIADGATAAIHFPSLTISAVSIDNVDLLVLTGTEPSGRWRELAAELAGLADTLEVTKVVAVGAVPAMVPHTLQTPVMVTSTDPTVEPTGIPGGRLVVPAALVSVLADHVAKTNDIAEVGFWAQVPHYVSGVYWPGVETMMNRLSTFLGVRTDLDEIQTNAYEMVTRLDKAVAERPDVAEFITALEGTAFGFGLEDTVNLTDEIEDFLRSLGDEGNPSS